MRHRALLAVAWLGVVGAVGFAATVATANKGPGKSSCGGEWPIGFPKLYDPKPLTPPTELQPYQEGDSIALAFDDTHHDAAAYLDLQAANWNQSQLNHYGLVLKLAGGYLRAGKDKIGVDRLFASINVVRPDEAELCLHAPKGLHVPHAGKYASRLQVLGGTNQLVGSVPVELTHRDSRLRAVGVALFGVLLGLTFKALSEAAAGQRERKVGPWRALKDYGSRLDFWACVILGIVVGAIIFDKVYIRDQGWGGSSGVLTLFGLCFLGQLSSNEGINIVRRAVGG